MASLQYSFEDLPQEKSDGYIFQIIKNRNLSKIYHSHNFFEVIFLISGKADHLINGKTVTMMSGDCALLVPGDKHAFLSHTENVYLVGISASCEEVLKLCDFFRAKDFLIGGSNGILFNVIKELSYITELCNTYGYSEEKWTVCRYLLSLAFMRICSGENNKHREIPLNLKNAMEKMNLIENLREGTNALVRISNYSYPHLNRLTKIHYGTTPHMIVAKLRLKAALDLLLYSNKSCENIAVDVGYNSVGHFIKVFTEEYGMTPAVMRRHSKEINTI